MIPNVNLANGLYCETLDLCLKFCQTLTILDKILKQLAFLCLKGIKNSQTPCGYFISDASLEKKKNTTVFDNIQATVHKWNALWVYKKPCSDSKKVKLSEIIAQTTSEKTCWRLTAKLFYNADCEYISTELSWAGGNRHFLFRRQAVPFL